MRSFQIPAASRSTIALLFWLSSIVEMDKNKAVVTPTFDKDYSFLYNLLEDEVFTLRVILQHEALTVEQHAEIYRQDTRKSASLLGRMHNAGILVKSNGLYQIHPFLYKLIINVLKSKNLLS